MKRFIPLLSLIICLIFSSAIWAANWYVDGWNGDDSNGGTSDQDAFETIKRALDRCSNGDTIRLFGEFAEAPWDTTWGGGNGWDNSTRTIQISVDKSNITLTNYIGVSPPYDVPVIYGYSPDAPDEHNDYVLRIDNTGNTIEKIKFDGYYWDSGQSTWLDVYTHDVIFMTPEADNTEISNCEFTNFGYDWHEDLPDDYWFYGIVTGGWSKQANTLDNVDIMYNTFYDNPFESQGAHEIYLTKTSGAEVKYNHILNNGAGHPLKLRDGCSNVEFMYNTVHGAHFCYLGDYREENESYSTGTIVKGNTFGDSLDVIDEDVYEMPFKPHANFISTFEDNTIYEFSTADSRYIQGLTWSEENDLFVTHKNSSHSEAFVSPNPHAPGPANGYGFSADNYYCQGDMCTINGYVLFCSQYSGTQRVYKDAIDGDFDNGANPSDTLSVGPNETVTAMARYNDNTFLTAIRDTGNSEVRIYQSTISDLTNSLKLNKSFTFADSITAMAYNGTDIVFATYKSGTSKIYKGTLSNLNNAAKQDSDISGYISAMCFARGYLVTAVYDSGQDESKLYYGTSSDPTSSYTSSYSDIIFIALTGDYGTTDDDYLYSLVHDTSSGTNCKKIYFTKDVTDYDDQLYFYSQWFKYF